MSSYWPRGRLVMDPCKSETCPLPAPQVGISQGAGRVFRKDSFCLHFGMEGSGLATSIRPAPSRAFGTVAGPSGDAALRRWRNRGLGLSEGRETQATPAAGPAQVRVSPGAGAHREGRVLLIQRSRSLSRSLGTGRVLPGPHLREEVPVPAARGGTPVDRTATRDGLRVVARISRAGPGGRFLATRRRSTEIPGVYLDSDVLSCGPRRVR